MEERIKEFKDLHTKLLVQIGLEFKKHGFAPTPISIKYDNVLDLTTQEVFHV